MTIPRGRWQSSGVITEDKAVNAGACIFKGVIVVSDGTNDAYARVYDHATAASGTEVASVSADATGHTAAAMIPGNDGVHMTNGIFVDWNGTNARAYVIYSANR